MSLLNMLNQVQGGQGLGQLADSLGMDKGQASGLAEMLAPAIGSAAKRRAESGGAESLLAQLKGEAQSNYFDDPAAAAQPEAQEAGQNFLDQILGSRDASQQLAQEAASRAGVEQGQVEQFMPALAAMLQGGMQRQTPDSSIEGMLSGLMGGQSSGGGGGGGIMGLVSGLLGGGSSSQSGGGGFDLGSLTQMLDADGDGSPLDDILEKVMR